MWNFRRAAPNRPSSPVPNMTSVPGSGVPTVCWKLNDMPSIKGLCDQPVREFVTPWTPLMLHWVIEPAKMFDVQKLVPSQATPVLPLDVLVNNVETNVPLVV